MVVEAALYRAPGPAREVLRVERVARPEPGPGEVRVRLVFSAINPTDYKTRAGVTARPIDEFQIPHQDGAGEIDAVGAGVDRARIGQRVWVWLAAAGRRWGTAAQWTVVPARRAVPLPEGVPWELAACLGVPALTAHRCLFADGPIAGKTVMVAGGAGAVGHFAIELAKHAGATVVATVSGAAKADLARAAGADLVVNYRDADVADQIRAFTPAVDRVIEVALGANAAVDLAVAAPGAVITTYASEPTDPTLPTRALMTANLVLRFVLLYGVPDEALDAAVRDITVALEAGALTALPTVRFPLADIVAAHEHAEAGVTGKVLVDVG